MGIVIDPDSTDLLTYVQTRSGQDILACYHCRKCTAGCPAAPFMDLTPDAVLRAIRYGNRDEVLASSAIWLCTGCHTCGARCPNEINLAPVMDALKQLASAEGIRGPERAVPVFHRLFLAAIERRGRVNEARLLAALKLRTGRILKDVRVGMQLLRAGRLPLRAEAVEDMDDIRALAARVRRKP